MPAVILGTAQWGMPYGVTNRHGIPSDSDIRDLMAIAERFPVVRLDSAAAYGNAEARIADLGLRVPVQTKITAKGLDGGEIRAEVMEARARLGGSLAGVLVHDWGVLSSSERRTVIETLAACRGDGSVDLVGISIYEADELDDLHVTDGSFDALPDIVQLPVSLVDQRLEGDARIAALRGRGVRIQARSVLLQGLLADGATAAPLSEHPDLVRIRAVCGAGGVSPIAAALGFVRSRSWIDEVVLAASNGDELRELHEAWAAAIPDLDWRSLASEDMHLLDPRRWSPKDRSLT